MTKQCMLCKMYDAVVTPNGQTDYCSIECCRFDRLCVRIQRAEGCLIEIKYMIQEVSKAVQESNQKEDLKNERF